MAALEEHIHVWYHYFYDDGTSDAHCHICNRHVSTDEATKDLIRVHYYREKDSCKNECDHVWYTYIYEDGFKDACCAICDLHVDLESAIAHVNRTHTEKLRRG